MWPWKKRAAIIEPLPNLVPAETLPSVPEAPELQQRRIPTVKFDPKRVTDEVRSDIAAALKAEARLSNAWAEVYPEAVLSVQAGGNLARLAGALKEIGWSSGEAGEFARYINFRATAIMNRRRQLDLGITEAVWLYSGAPCHPYGKITAAQKRLDELHKAADGQKFQITKGMKIGGRYTWPGMARHCKCLSNAIVPGLS